MNYLIRRVANMWEASDDDNESPTVAFGETPNEAIMNFMDQELMRLKADAEELLEELNLRS